MAGREIGIVKWYDDSEGYGFIARKKGADVYVHYSAILCEESDCHLRQGAPVEFSVTMSGNGPQAQDVIVLN